MFFGDGFVQNKARSISNLFLAKHYLEMISTEDEDQTTHNEKENERNSRFPCSTSVGSLLSDQLI